MILSFHPCFTGDNQIILGARKLKDEELGLIQKAQAIILPQSCSAELYQACRQSSALLFPCFDVRFQYPGKVGQALLFERLNLRYPLTRIWSNVDEFQRSCRAPQAFPHALPFLIKTDQDHEGTGVFLIENQAMLKAGLERLAGSQPFISQDFIPAQGNVLRTIVIGPKYFFLLEAAITQAPAYYRAFRGRRDRPSLAAGFASQGPGSHPFHGFAKRH
jgi:ribosomal protein S6--L-glutamate ligase